MKTLLVTVSLAVAGVSGAHAQVFRSSVGGGAAIGAVAGSLIGGHNNDRWAEGAIIGAAAGAIIGALAAPAEQVATPPPVYQAPVYGVPPVAVVPDAPQVGAPAPVQVVQAQAPQVVYVESAPRVVYVTAPAPRVVYAAPPVVSFGIGIRSGPRYYAPPPVYRHQPYYHHGHRR